MISTSKSKLEKAKAEYAQKKDGDYFEAAVAKSRVEYFQRAVAAGQKAIEQRKKARF